MLNIGDILDGKYEVIKVLGRGGMSTVYLCKNQRLQNLWAIKEVKRELKDNMDFLTEPNLLKNLSHAGIPRIVDIFYELDYLYIVEDYIQGETLEKYVKRKCRLETEEIVKISLKLCDILEYLHSFNPPIIYRDLKPSNIMIKIDGSITLIDFGISRVYKNDKSSDTIFMGSRGYAAPEQYGTGQSETKTDIYGIGAVMYFMALGEAPSSLLEPLKNESYRDADTGIIPVIQRSMQIEVNDRYDSIRELKNALENIFSNLKSNRTMILDKTSEGSTRVLQRGKSKEQIPEKEASEITKKSKSRKQGNYKKIAILVPLVLIIMAMAAFAAIKKHDGKLQESHANTNNTSGKTENTPSSNTANNKADSYGKDYSSSGYIDLSQPININTNEKNNPPRGKGRNKDKVLPGNKDAVMPGNQNTAYQVNPAAIYSKNDNKLTMQLKYIEQKGNNIIVYCNIVNNTGVNVGFDYGNVILTNDLGEYARADEAQSTNISSIPDDGTDRYVEIAFDNFNLNGDSLMLMTKISSPDDIYNGKAMNLTVNIK